MSLDHLNKESPAETGEIQLPFSIISLVFVTLILFCRFYCNIHFYIFGVIAHITFWMYDFWIYIQDFTLYWYLLICFNHVPTDRKDLVDSTQNRDHET